MALLGIIPGVVVHPFTLLKYFIGLPLAFVLLYLVQNEIVRYRSHIENLPGPLGWPVVGNLFQVLYSMLHL